MTKEAVEFFPAAVVIKVVFELGEPGLDFWIVDGEVGYDVGLNLMGEEVGVAEGEAAVPFAADEMEEAVDSGDGEVAGLFEIRDVT